MIMSKRGQSTLEYALIIAVVLGALLAMQHYMRRGIEGRLRTSADSVGTQFSANRSTVNISTRQETAVTTRETFGINATTGADADGVSGYRVVTAGIENVSTTERVQDDLGAESIF